MFFARSVERGRARDHLGEILAYFEKRTDERPRPRAGARRRASLSFNTFEAAVDAESIEPDRDRVSSSAGPGAGAGAGATSASPAMAARAGNGAVAAMAVRWPPILAPAAKENTFRAIDSGNRGAAPVAGPRSPQSERHCTKWRSCK